MCSTTLTITPPASAQHEVAMEQPQSQVQAQSKPSLDPRVEEFLKRHFTVQWKTSTKKQQQPKTSSSLKPSKEMVQKKFEKIAESRRSHQAIVKADNFWKSCDACYRALQLEAVCEMDCTKDCSESWNSWPTMKSLTSLVNSSDAQQVFRASDFLLLQKLGHGGYGSVYKAVHVPTGHVVALKELDRDSSSVETHDQRLLPLDCGVVPCYGTFRAMADDKNPVAASLKQWIVMKLCKTGTLKDRLNEQGALSRKEAAHILKRVTKILLYLHDVHGIVHNDIKAANVLLEEEGSVMLCDLGVAKKGLWQTDRLGGTYSHMAPEKLSARKLASGRYHNDQSIDVWALGVMLFEMIFNDYPFAHFNVFSKYTTVNPALMDVDAASHKIADMAQSYKKLHFPKRNGDAPDELLHELLRDMLAFDAQERLDLVSVRKHPWIKRHGKWSDRALVQLRSALGVNSTTKKDNHKAKVVPDSPSTHTTISNSSRRFSFRSVQPEL